MTCRERRKFNFARRKDEATAGNPEGSLSTPAPELMVVATATTTPSKTRVQEVRLPQGPALPRPTLSEAPSVRPKEAVYQLRQLPVAQSLVQRVAHPPQPIFVQSDYRYPPISSGIIGVPITTFGGPAHFQPPLPPYPTMLVQLPNQQARASSMAQMQFQQQRRRHHYSTPEDCFWIVCVSRRWKGW